MKRRRRHIIGEVIRIQQELPNGATITQHTSDKRRYYTVLGDVGVPEDAQLPSVTSIIGIINKPYLTPWAVKLATETMTEMVINLFNGQYRNSVGVGAKVSSHRSLMMNTAREWLRRGEEHEVVVQELQRLNNNLLYGAKLETGEVRQLVENTDNIARNERYSSFPESVKQIAEIGKKQYRFTGSQAAEIGTEVHELIEAYFHGAELETTLRENGHRYREEVVNALWGFLDYYENNAKDLARSFIEPEQMVYHPLGFAGTIDGVFRNTDGGITIIDWKTSKSIYEDYSVQMAAYAIGFKHVFGEAVDRARVVRFDKAVAGKWQEKEVNLKSAKAHFLSLLKLYQCRDKKEYWV